MKTYHCLIVEDEPLAQRVVQKYLQRFSQLRLVATCENSLQAFSIISRVKVDLLFLDITLPTVSGIDLIRSLKNPPAVIFTTAYSEYAVTSYELEAVDYLLKPITFDRFRQSINKFLRTSEKVWEADSVLVKASGKWTKVFYRDIIFIEARKDYLLFCLTFGSIITHMTLKAVSVMLPSHFVRIHRSYIVSKEAVTGIGGGYVEAGGHKLPVGEKFKADALRALKVG